MNIWNIALKEIKSVMRDSRTLIFMLAFPIVLMLILGTALSNVFNNEIRLDEVQVLYKDMSKGVVTQQFESFTKEVAGSGIQFTKAAGDVDGAKEVEQNHYTAYVELRDSGIDLYGSGRNTVESSIVEGMLHAFVGKYNVAVEVVKADPKLLAEVVGTPPAKDYIQESSLQADKQPGSMDYYALAMTTMIAMYAAMPASSLLRGERNRKTADRLLASPISKSELFVGKILGSLAIQFLGVLIVVAFSKYVFHAYWGEHMGIVILVLLTEMLLAISFGLIVSYISTGVYASMILMIVVQVSSFLGGTYFYIGDTEGIASLVTNLSPLRWVNQALTRVIYENDLSAAIPVVCLNVGLAALFLLLTRLSLHRREGL
ncbi:MAG: transporter, permease protein [Paenibacillus sp.]|nr:transporter, permease protein [Paenibacillus sp.]